ncbi:raftlin-like isoform X2 [Engraulis encrasicolus]
MGCGLRKLRQAEDGSPGKIYSTLKRPQVETKIGVAYTYRHLDFLVGKDDGTSTLQVSSVRELPAQVLELYQQGFVLAAVHPFVHPCGPEPARVQRQLYRAVLVRLADSVDKGQSEFEPCSLRLEECLSAERYPSTEHIQGYVKKQIQDAADQGIMFVGFIQEPGRVRAHHLHHLHGLGDPEEPSLSLHSSPSSLHSSGLCQTPSPLHHSEGEGDKSGALSPASLNGAIEEPGKEGGRGGNDDTGDVVTEEGSSVPASPSSRISDLESPTHNNNDTKASQRTNKLGSARNGGMELFALYNQPCSRDGQVKYYTVKVPLRVAGLEEGEGGVPSVEANWLDHMTQHFNNGASLVDGYFHLSDVANDSLPKSVDSVFIFQEGLEGDSSSSLAYDAIVVEQWTIIDGVQVKTDYIPLLQSLAMYGWRLTCVLPTPMVKTNSDGSLCTKQIVFLQRPVLPRKKREAKKLIFKTRNKSNKNSVKDAPKGKSKKKDAVQADGRDLDDQKISDIAAEKVIRVGEQEGEDEEEEKEERKGQHREERGKSTELDEEIKQTTRAQAQAREAEEDEGGIETVGREIEQEDDEGDEETAGGEAEQRWREAEEGGERNDSRASSSEPQMNGQAEKASEHTGEVEEKEKEEEEEEGNEGEEEMKKEGGQSSTAEVSNGSDLCTQVREAESDLDKAELVAMHLQGTLTNGSVGEGTEREDKTEVAE